MAKTRKHQKTSGLKIRGFYRVNIVEQDGRIVGDSGWLENQVVNNGVLQYLITPLVGGAAKSVARMALGSGTTPAATDNVLPGEITDGGSASRVTIGASQLQGSTRVDLPATWLSSNNFVTTSHTIANIMIINDTTSGGTIFAGNTFASSELHENQDYLELCNVAIVNVPLAA